MKRFPIPFLGVLIAVCCLMNHQSFSQCAVIYASTSGSALGDGTEANPYDLQTALTEACVQNRKHIRLFSGTYNLTAKMVVGCDDIIIDGDWEVFLGRGRKNSSLATTININSPVQTSSYNGGGGTTVGFYVGVEAIGRSNTRIQDITFNVKNGGLSGTASGTTGNRGRSVYGFYFRNSPNFNLVRCIMNAGRASRGTNGTSRPQGASGQNGANGTRGHCDDDCITNRGGAGGNGGGAANGAGTNIDGSCRNSGQNGGTGGTATLRSGGGGGAGGTGGAEDNSGGTGGNGGSNLSAGGGTGATAGGGLGTGNGGTGTGTCSNVNGKNGSSGGSGADGTNGSTPTISTTFDLYWLPNGQSTAGTDGRGGGGGHGGGGGGGQGCFFCTDGTGSAGGGGGGGGQGGQAGTGGWGAGSTFALYTVASSGTRTNVTLNTAPVQTGGTGGSGGLGGNGGSGGSGGSLVGNIFGCATCEVGEGGNGGSGGAGGDGGNGGNGANGRSEVQRTISGSTVSTVSTPAIGPTITNEPLEACQNSEIIITKTGGTWTLPADAAYIPDLNATTSTYNNGSATAIISYSTTGSQDIDIDGNTYQGFIQINTARPLPVFDASMTNIVCEGDPFTMNTTTSGIQYEWIVFDQSNTTTTPIAIFNTSVASYPTPVTGTTRNYSVRLRVRTNCCGWSTPVYFDFTIAGNTVGPTASGATICEGETASLSATAAGGGNLNWYSDPLGQVLLQSSPGPSASFTTPQLTQTSVFYVGEAIASCAGALTAVPVTVDPLPNLPSAAPVAVCEGDDVVLEATGSGTGDLVFYDNGFVEIGRTTMSVANPSATLNLGPQAAGSYLYYVREDDGNCESTLAAIGVNVNAAPAAPTSPGTTICEGESTTLTASGTGTVEWYADAALTNLLSTGSSFNTPTLTATTDYYAVVVDANGCRSLATMTTVTVDPAPAAPAATDPAICSGQQATITATGSGGTISWYEDPAGTILLNTGTSFTTPVLTQNTTYYLQEESAAGCFSSIAAVTVTVNPLPAAPLANNVSYCASDNAVLTATGGSGTLNWYNVATGGTSLATGGSYNAGVLAAGTYTYYVDEDDGTCVSPRTAVLVTVNPLPAAPTSTGVTICAGESANLLATGSGTIQWYSDAALTTVVGSGNSYNAGSLTTNTTYYAAQTDGNGCQSTATAVTVTVNPVPANPVATGATICSGNSAALTATGSGGVLTWYSDASGSFLLAAGATFNTPPLSQATTYFVQEVNASGCASGFVPVTVTVNPTPNTPSAQDVTICEGDDAVLSATGSGTGDLVFYNVLMVEVSRTTMSAAVPSATYNAGALSPGSFNFFVAEDNGTCISSMVPVVVNVNATPLAATTTTDTVCAGQMATLTASGGGSISWFADAALSNQVGVGNVFMTSMLTGNTSYWAVVTDTNACSSAATQVDVVVNVAPAAPTAANDTACAGNSVVLTATGSGGTIDWYTDATGSTVLATGATLNISTINQTTIYYVGETNASGCSSPLTAVTVVVNPSPNAPTAPDISVCEGSTVTLSATGSGNGNLIFYDNTGTQIGSGPMSMANPTVTFAVGTLPAGSYTYSVAEEQGSGCLSLVSGIVVTVQATPAAPTALNDSPVCEGDDVFLQASTIMGATYNWTGPNGFSSGLQSQMLTNVTAAQAGTYSVVATLNGCNSAAATTNVTINAKPVIAGAITNNSPLCEGQTLTLTAPAVGGATYSWSGPNGFSSTQSTISIPNVSEVDQQGFYTLEVVDATTGCVSDPVSTLVTINRLPQPGMAFSNSPLCAGSTLELSVPEVLGATYSWEGPNGFTSTDQNPTVSAVTGAEAGLYTVTVALGNCVAALDVNVAIDTIPNVTVIGDTTITEGEQLVLFATGGVLYQWSPGDYLSSVNSPTPVFSGAPAGTYNYAVNITDGKGCAATSEVVIEVEASSTIVVTDLFTPNDDGFNDTWVIDFLQNVDPYTIQVFSRGGLEVYYSENYANDWNGTHYKSGKRVPDGTYYYLIRTQTREYAGAVTIKR